MVYRVQIDVSLKDIKDVEAFIADIKSHAAKIETALDMTGKAANMMSLDQPMSVKYHRCYHDEATPKPCDGYVIVDMAGEKVAALAKG